MPREVRIVPTLVVREDEDDVRFAVGGERRRRHSCGKEKREERFHELGSRTRNEDAVANLQTSGSPWRVARK
jgi:hypothetical protein